MDAAFYRHLTDSHPLLREHVRMGEPGAGLRTQSDATAPSGVASGFAVLDAFLPWRGWPCGAMTEIMTDTPGCGELSLLMPTMARLTQQKRPILCLGAPHELFAPALQQANIDPAFVTQIHPAPTSSTHQKENLWATEQALRTGLPGLVLLWSPPRVTLAPETLRRLHLACLAGPAMGSQSSSSASATMLIHFRGAGSMSQPSPAWLRFGYAADDRHIRLQVLKCRGRDLARPLITLDRAVVQARLYGQLAASRRFDNMIEFGTTAMPQIVRASHITATALTDIASRADALSHASAAAAAHSEIHGRAAIPAHTLPSVMPLAHSGDTTQNVSVSK